MNSYKSQKIVSIPRSLDFPAQEDISHVSVHAQGQYLGAADDGGEVKIIDLHQINFATPFKTLRNGHQNVCSTFEFRPCAPTKVT
jgi:hypothetical protein